MSQTYKIRFLWILVIALVLIVVGVTVISGIKAQLAPATHRTTIGGNIIAVLPAFSLDIQPNFGILADGALRRGTILNGTLLVTNTTKTPLIYSMETFMARGPDALPNGDEELSKALVFTVSTGGFGETGELTCSGPAIDPSQPGRVIYTGPYSSIAPLPIFGNSASGVQAGDRPLDIDQAELLCLQVVLPKKVEGEVDLWVTPITNVNFRLTAEEILPAQ